MELLRHIRNGQLLEKWREEFFERCAIVEFDGKMSRMEAEAIALAELKAKVSHESK